MSTKRGELLERLEKVLLELAFVLIEVQAYFNLVTDQTVREDRTEVAFRPKGRELNFGFRTAIHDVWELVFWAPRTRETDGGFKDFCKEAIQRVRKHVEPAKV